MKNSCQEIKKYHLRSAHTRRMRVEFIAGESWKIWKNYRANRPIYLVQLFLNAIRCNRQFTSTQSDASRRRLSDRLNRPTRRP